MGEGHGDRQVTPGIGDLKWGKVMATDKGVWERMRMRMRLRVRVRVWERVWGQVCVRVRVLWARGIGQTSKMGIKLLQNYYYYSYIHEHANQGKRLLWR